MTKRKTNFVNFYFIKMENGNIEENNKYEVVGTYVNNTKDKYLFL